MSGLMDYVIQDEFFKSVREEVTCSICLDIKIDPLMCQKCQNSYCAKCIEDWQKNSYQCPFKCENPSYFPARIVKNLICKLNFKCKKGCNKIIPYEKLQSHYESDCEKLNFKERYENLLIKFNELSLEKKQLEGILDSLFKSDINSAILTKKDEIYFIYKILSEHYNSKFKLELLYRATRDGDSGRNFHERCDNKTGGVLIVIQTDKNIKFGGFSDAVWVSYSNPERKTIGRNICGNVNFLYQVNKKKKYALKHYMKVLTAIFCRGDVGPCFGELGEDIWIRGNFFQRGGALHKDKDKGRICSYDTADYELTNGERNFNIKELEAFWLIKNNI